jgi:hypothetical protein
MSARPLPPEARLLLRVQLDRLSAAGDRCRDGLQELSDGRLTREGYREVLAQLKDAQRDWERKTERYLRDDA